MLESAAAINSAAAATMMWQLAIVIGLGVLAMLPAAMNRLDRGLPKE